MTAWHRYDPGTGRVTLTLHVQPNATASAVAGLHGDALKIRIAAPAADNKANQALVDFLHRLLELRTSQISIRHGAHGRRKIVEIAGADAALLARLNAVAKQ
ncbi:MAG: DUF167 domain-containing protein [Betaproteobacteria bacterium]|nr:DUF167 domain-containing protein [Betaproteobacteria bacterium]